MDPVVKMLIDDYGIDPRTAQMMAKDVSAGKLQMSGGVSAGAMQAGMRDSAATGMDLPDQYQNQIPHYATASRDKAGVIDSHLAAAQAAINPVLGMVQANQQQVQGNQAQALAGSIAPRPPAYNPANDPTGQGMAAAQDLNDTVDRGQGYDPQAQGRFNRPAGQPTVGPPDYSSSIQKYKSQLMQQLGPSAEAQFQKEMMKTREQLQQQMAAIDAALGNQSTGLEMGEVNVRNAPSMQMGNVTVRSVR